MPHIKKLTPQYFEDTKRIMRWTTNKRTANKTGLSLKTVLQIRGSKTYKEHQEQNKAQHPDVQFSLGEHVLNLHKLVFDKGDNKYIAPPTARLAIVQLEYEL